MENVSENLVHVKENIDGQDPIAVEKLQIIVKELFFFLFSDEGMEGFLSFESHWWDSKRGFYFKLFHFYKLHILKQVLSCGSAATFST